MSLADLLKVGMGAVPVVEKAIPLSTDEFVPRATRFSDKPPDSRTGAGVTSRPQDNASTPEELSSRLKHNLEELMLAQELVESQEEVLKADADTRQAEQEALQNKAIDDAASAAKKLAKHMASQRKAEPMIPSFSVNPFSTGGAVEFPRGKWVGDRVSGPPLTTLDKVRQQARESGCWGKGAGWGVGEWADGWGVSDVVAQVAAWGCGADSSWGKGAWPTGKGVGWAEAGSWDVGAGAAAAFGAGASWGSSSSAAAWSPGYAVTKGYGAFDSGGAAAKGGGPYACKGGSFGFGGSAKGKGYDGFGDRSSSCSGGWG